MPLIALASVKGSPGVTTTCLALAATWPGQDPRLLIEADPAGGDLGPWLGLPGAPGLTGLAAAARHDHSPGLPWEHSRELPGGLHLVMGPAGAEQATACLMALAASGVPASLAAAAGTVIADCGRLDPGSPALAIATRARLTLLLVRPRVGDLSHLALRAQALSAAGARLALLLAPDGRGGASYAPAEITATLGIPVQARIPADPSGSEELAFAIGGGLRRVRRHPLGRAAASLATTLAAVPRQHSQSPPAATPSPAALRSRHLAEVTPGDAAR